VSQGGVLRALRKEEGPDRVLQSSYGFLRSEPYMDKKEFKEAHNQQEPWRDPIDGLQYIENTIRWEIHKVTRTQLPIATFTTHGIMANSHIIGHNDRG
jgi:hypothetical protein